jgi:hypothetical protein
MGNPIDRFNASRTPPRPPEILVGTPTPPPPSSLVSIVFDGTRSGRCYSGHILTPAGVVGDAVRFVIDNDPGTDTMPDDATVWAIPAPSRLADDGDLWSGSGDKYVAISTVPYCLLA